MKRSLAALLAWILICAACPAWADSEDADLLCELSTGGAVTISLYRESTGATVTCSGACDDATEIAATGIYKWSTSAVTTWPGNDNYLYRCFDGTTYTEWTRYERGGGSETVRTIDANVKQIRAKTGGGGPR